MNNPQDKSVVPEQIIMQKIFFVRGQNVMLDSDLAELYEVTTSVLNQAVNRNLKRFPNDFMFQLDEQEWANLKSQIVISSWGGRRKIPYVFTEQGVAMLSGVLNSDRAIAVNIQIMRMFIRIRQILMDNSDLRLEVNKIKRALDNQSKNMEIVFQYLDELIEKKHEPRKQIGYKPEGF